MLEVKVEKAGILENVKFSVPSESVLGIAGKNGSGKTTLLKFISGVVKGTGEVNWKGVNLSSFPFKERMKVINIVPQNFDPFLNYSVYEVIDASSPVYLKREVVDEALERVGLGGRGGRIFASLSGGEKVRVLIARLLAVNPEIVLFDEPSAFLDPDLTVSIASIVKDLKKDNKTVLIASHDVAFLLDVCDLFLGLKNGNMVFFGNKEEFLSAFSDIYDVPLKVVRVNGEIFIKPNYGR